ncbi:MAG TPA: hypothetical protein VEV16_05160 [Daejeonella sp.]|nr:hypothetical protein [Daejeonella sp.]
MKTLLNNWFIIFCLIWLLVFTGRKLDWTIPIINSYLTDLLAVPVVMQLALAFQRTFVERNENYCFKAGHVIFVVFYISLVFEWLLPRLDAKFTSDGMDILMYILGGLIFWFQINRPIKIIAPKQMHWGN